MTGGPTTVLAVERCAGAQRSTARTGMLAAMVVVLLPTVVLSAAMVLTGPEAGAAGGACPTSEGVTVVVDFQGLGGGVYVRCASGDVDLTGLEVLAVAGINYQTATRQPGFLCKIDGKPSDDPCQNTSPASAYWSYWVAPRGGQWCYSEIGAGYRKPPAGTVEGWSFSLDKSAATAPPPRAPVPAAVPGSPAQLPAKDCRQSADSSSPAAPSPSTTTASVNAIAGSAPGPAAGRPPAGLRSPATASPGVTTTAAPAPVQPADSAPTTTTATASSESADVDVRGDATTNDDLDVTIDTESAAVDLRENGATDEADGGSPLGVVVAVALVAALGLGAFLRRRRANVR